MTTRIRFRLLGLLLVIPEPGAWFAWAEFHPDTEVYAVHANNNPHLAR